MRYYVQQDLSIPFVRGAPQYVGLAITDITHELITNGVDIRTTEWTTCHIEDDWYDEAGEPHHIELQRIVAVGEVL